MPQKKLPCPTCDGLMGSRSSQCRKCKPTYERTPETKARMSAAVAGKPKPWLLGRERPEHSKTMKDYWTPERREAKRREVLARNPGARYHGLSVKAAKRMTTAVGSCQKCGHDGSESRLDVHHRDRDKRNQSLANLQVLCH